VAAVAVADRRPQAVPHQAAALATAAAAGVIIRPTRRPATPAAAAVAVLVVQAATASTKETHGETAATAAPALSGPQVLEPITQAAAVEVPWGHKWQAMAVLAAVVVAVVRLPDREVQMVALPVMLRATAEMAAPTLAAAVAGVRSTEQHPAPVDLVLSSLDTRSRGHT